MDVHVGDIINWGDIYWLVTEQVDRDPQNFVSEVIIPGTFYDNSGDATQWDLGDKTTWTDEVIERDGARIVPSDEWTDEMCRLVAMCQLGVLTEGED